MNKKRIIKYIVVALIVAVISISYYIKYANDSENSQRANLSDQIVILFTNDVHCCVDQYIGYSGLAAYKKQALQETPNVTLVDCGDAIQGEYIGTISKGDYIVEIMNKVGYDLAICGNHEFSFGPEVTKNVIEHSNAKYLNCNISYNGTKFNPIEKTASYTIMTYGKTKIGFIGVTTPSTANTSTPLYFQEDGKFVYDFKSHNNGKDLIYVVQNAVNACLQEGAHYVVLLAHLGVGTGLEPFTSTNLIANTTGIDAVLDGHSHSTLPCTLVPNKHGINVVLCSTGTKLRNIGRLNISPNGINSELVTQYPNKDSDLTEFISGIKASYNRELRNIIGTSTTHLSGYDKRYVRLIRNRETNLGDWCADALLFATEGDIALFNGGSIRSDIKPGVITVGNLKDVDGFNNMVCKVKATGQEILDTLEMSYRKTMNVTTTDGKWSVGENGGFLQIAGLKCTIDTSLPTYVIVDDNGMFEKVSGPRRVKDVMVKQNGVYEPIDPNKTYTVVSTDYLIKECGDGINTFEKHDLLLDSNISVTQAYIDYFKHLNGDLSQYEEPQGRIIIK